MRKSLVLFFDKGIVTKNNKNQISNDRRLERSELLNLIKVDNAMMMK